MTESAQAPAASEQPAPGDTVAVTWDDGHESEDTVRPSGYYTGANSVERGEATVRVTEQEWQDFDAALAECRGQRPAVSEQPAQFDNRKIDAAVELWVTAREEVAAHKLRPAIEAMIDALGLANRPAVSEDVIKRAAGVLSEEERRHLAGEVPTGGHGYFAGARALDAAGLLASHPVTDEAVERVARALFVHDAKHGEHDPMWFVALIKADYLSRARVAIAALTGGQP